MAGRRTKYTPDTVKRLTDAIRLGGSDRDACVYAGISEDTLARWRVQHADFAENLDRARMEGKLQRIGRIAQAGAKGDWRADAWYLERRWPEEYAQTFIIKVTPDDAAILKRLGMTASEAWQQLMQELANADADR